MDSEQQEKVNEEEPQAGAERTSERVSRPPEQAAEAGAAAGESSPPTADEAGGEGSAEAEPSELEQTISERDKLKQQLLRTAADFDNFRKRTRRDLDDAKARGKDDVLRDLLPVFDNLERAVEASTGASDVESVLEGVRMVLKLFHDTAERMGLTRIPGVGSRFDPNVHEAIQQQESDEHPSGTVLSEVMAGYRIDDRLIRAAMVVVARAPTKKASNPAPSQPAAASDEAEATARASDAPAADSEAAAGDAQPAGGNDDDAGQAAS
ncbi:MAG: nucleotide exchange factor GrpE [Myxococcales bacterium]|nr:nucleotide exchange factor GrpE [Myxococcales bacterium]